MDADAGTIAKERLYFLMVDGEKVGPLRRDELIGAGMEKDSRIWFEGCTSWVKAGVIPELIELFEAERKARKQRRRERREVAKLPAPGALQWLARVALLIHVPAGALYLLSTLVLIVTFFVWLGTGEDGPRQGSTIASVISIMTIAGLVTLGVSLLLLLAELIVIAMFILQCRRIVTAISPDAYEESLLTELFNDLSNNSIGVPDVAVGGMGGAPRILFVGGALAVIIVILVLLCVFMIAVAITMLAMLFVILVMGTVWITLVSTIPKLGDGLNRVIEEYHMDVPKMSRRLCYWTAVSALLVLFGPFSLPVFALVPIWLYQTANKASLICELRREAVDGTV